MAFIRYYPLSRIQTGLYTNGGAYAVEGKPYRGAYYLTYDGKAYTGTNPFVGPNEELTPIESRSSSASSVANTGLSTTSPLAQATSSLAPVVNNIGISTRSSLRASQSSLSKSLEKATQSKNSTSGALKQVVAYYPSPLESDYARGFFMRYFAKRIADKGYITEVSVEDWNNIQKRDDPTYLDYEVESMMWQLTGPLTDTRVSQYQIKGGVETTNKRITEQKAKTFIGLVEFIGGDYTKFARIDK